MRLQSLASISVRSTSLTKPLHVAQLRVGEAPGEPAGLAPEVAHFSELPPANEGFVLLREVPAGLVGNLAGAGDLAGVPGVARPGVAFPLARLDQAGGEPAEPVGPSGEIVAGPGQRGEAVHQTVRG